MAKNKIVKQLKEVFGGQGFFGGVGFHGNTGSVLLNPSRYEKEAAIRAAKEMDLDGVLRDLAVITARELSTEFSQMNIRPADHTWVKDIPDILTDRLRDALKGQKDDFAKLLTHYLGMHG